jgi:hypothetical protein
MCVQMGVTRRHSSNVALTAVALGMGSAWDTPHMCTSRHSGVLWTHVLRQHFARLENGTYVQS